MPWPGRTFGPLFKLAAFPFPSSLLTTLCAHYRAGLHIAVTMVSGSTIGIPIHSHGWGGTAGTACLPPLEEVIWRGSESHLVCVCPLPLPPPQGCMEENLLLPLLMADGDGKENRQGRQATLPQCLQPHPATPPFPGTHFCPSVTIEGCLFPRQGCLFVWDLVYAPGGRKGVSGYTACKPSHSITFFRGGGVGGTLYPA